MNSYLDNLPTLVDKIRAVRNIIITNIVLIGEKSAPTFKEKNRVKLFMERLAEFQVDECSMDSYENPIGIIRGTTSNKPPIFVVAHLDTLVERQDFFSYSIKQNSISGPGVADNSTGVGILLSLPRIIKELKLQFKSDIVLAGVIQSIGKGNLRGVRHLLKTWEGPIRGAVCIEGVELGRFNYYSEGMLRGEIECLTSSTSNETHQPNPNAILILNEIINKILEIRLPQKPYSRIVIGKMNSGYHYGRDAVEGNIGFEIHSNADDIVKEIINDIKDIVESIKRIYKVNLKLKILSNLNATRLEFNHPLVKATNTIMNKLNLEPIGASSESELSIFLSKSIPSVTLGITNTNKDSLDSSIEIEPIFKGVTQIIGVMQAIDNGVCDGKKLA